MLAAILRLSECEADHSLDPGRETPQIVKRRTHPEERPAARAHDWIMPFLAWPNKKADELTRPTRESATYRGIRPPDC